MPQETDQKGFTAQVIYRFLGGAAAGVLVTAVPVFYSTSIAWNMTQIGVVGLAIVGCGTLSSLWGEKFITAITDALNSFPS